MNAGVLIFLVLAVVFLGVGVLLVIIALMQRNKAKKAESWQTVSGQITASTITENRHRDSDGHTQINYQPLVQYTYEIDGLTYNGGRIAFGANSFDYNTAQGMAAKYPVGASVTVHYDPAQPGEAVLETKAAGSKVFLIIGIVFAVIGLLSCCGTAVVALLSQQ